MLLVLTFINFVIFIYKIRGMSEIVIAFLTGVLGPILIIYIKHILDKKKKPDIVAEALEMGEVITNKIEEIKEVVNFYNFGTDHR